MRKIDEIILHCSATAEGKDFKAADIDKWHKKKGWKCIGYHFVIDLNGHVEYGRPMSMVGAHTVGHNANSIGICYIGGCDESGKKAKDTRTAAQKNALCNLVYDLLKLYPDAVISGHYQWANKACPSFKIEEFKKEFVEWLKTMKYESKCNFK